MKKMLCLLLVLVLLPLFPVLAEQEITVAASFYPVYVMAKNVLNGIEGVNVISMTAPATGCLHDYQLLTGDMRALSRATVLLINGAGMESFLPDIQAQFPFLPIVDCSLGVELLCDDAHDHEHDHDGHDHGEYNAHIWLSPKNAMQMVENMARELALLLPHAEDAIRQNAQEYQARLEKLDQELVSAISALPRKEIVTFHEAFPYFAHAYGLHVAAVITVEPDDPLSPKMLSEVIAQVKAAGNPPLFMESQYDSTALKVVSRETGAPVYELDSLASGGGELTAYEDAMRKNLKVLQEALQ